MPMEGSGLSALRQGGCLVWNLGERGWAGKGLAPECWLAANNVVTRSPPFLALMGRSHCKHLQWPKSAWDATTAECPHPPGGSPLSHCRPYLPEQERCPLASGLGLGPAWLCAHCVTLGKSLCISEPQCPHLYNGDAGACKGSGQSWTWRPSHMKLSAPWDRRVQEDEGPLSPRDGSRTSSSVHPTPSPARILLNPLYSPT